MKGQLLLPSPSSFSLVREASDAAARASHRPTPPNPGLEGEAKEPSDAEPKKKDKAASKDKADAKDKDEPKEDEGKSKASLCTGFDLNLLTALSHSACEVKDAKATDVKAVDMKNKLVVKLADSSKVEPGGKLEVMVQFTNKGKEPLALDFLLNPSPRFRTKAYDANEKRVDVPAGHEPMVPSGLERGAATQGVGRVTLVPQGTAHAKVIWDASKMRWAPEKLKGTPPEMGFPRVAAGPLGKGEIHAQGRHAALERDGRHRPRDQRAQADRRGREVAASAPPAKPRALFIGTPAFAVPALEALLRWPTSWASCANPISLLVARRRSRRPQR